MLNWVIQDLLQDNAPKLVGALLALTAAHSQLLQSWGLNINLQTFGGKLTIAMTLLVGMLAGHHATKAVTGGTNQ